MERGKKENVSEAGRVTPAGRMARLGFCVVMLVTLLISSAFAIWHASIQGEFAQAADRFGYLQMAADIRRGAAPGGLARFTFDSPQSRVLLDFLRARGELTDNASAGPSAYHYVAATDKIICQYPPGVGWMLSVLPEGRSVIAWRAGAVLVLLGLGVWVCLRDSGTKVLGASLMLLTAVCGMMIVVLAVSYSVDMLIIPLVTAVIAAFESRRGGRVGWTLAVVAGVAIGWACVMRLSAVFFVPGFVVLAWEMDFAAPALARRGARVAVFFAAFGVGILPLLFHQHAMMGLWFHSTYTPLDASQPSVQWVGRNLVYYFAGAGSDLILFLAIGAAAFVAWIIAGWKSVGMRGWGAGLWALVCWFVFPTSYFLTHEVITPYYQYLTIFITLLAMAWIVGKQKLEGKVAARTAVIAGWLILGFMTVNAAAFPWPSRELERLSALPDVTPPEALRDPHAWIFADRLSGTLWHYSGIASLQIVDMKVETRRAFLNFLKMRGEPVYVIADDPAMANVGRELTELGARFKEVGSYCLPTEGKGEAVPFTSVFRVEW